MMLDLFDAPLFAKRKGYIAEIAGLDDAFDLLEEWPQTSRDLAYEVIVKAVREAACGQRPLDAAREDLRRFLKRHGRLADVEDVPPPLGRRSDRNIGGN